MARKIGDTTLDLERERSLLSEFQVHCQSKRIAVIYGPKSREDSYYMQRVPWGQLGIAALMESLGQLGIPAKHVNPTEPGFLEALAGASIPQAHRVIKTAAGQKAAIGAEGD